MDRDDPTVKFDGVKCLKETDLALLIRFADGEELWIPKSQVDDDSEVFDEDDNAEGVLVISEFIALQKGLV